MTTVQKFLQLGTGAVNRDTTEKFYEAVSVMDFGAAGDGVTDDAAAIRAALTAVSTGGELHFPPGEYLIGSGIQVTLNGNISVYATGAKFIAKSGFPHTRLFMVLTGTATDAIFQWRGGDFDGTNIPNSLAGEANDVMSMNATNCSRCVIHLEQVITGSDIATGGGDSHIFVGGASNVDVSIGNSVGAVDAGIYISGDSTGTIGDSLIATGNYHFASVGIIVKRQFNTWTINGNFSDCLNGAAGGSATLGSGVLAPPGNGALIVVNATRCDRAVTLQGVRGATIVANIRDLGTKTAAFTSTGPRAVYLSGASHCLVQATIDGTNPLLTATSQFIGIDCDRRTIDVTDYDATDNFIIANVTGVGKAFREDANSDRNLFFIKDFGNSATSAVVGANSTMHRSTPSSTGFELDEPSVSLAGIHGAESLRALKVASQVNFLQVSGNSTGAASGVAVSATGSDTDVPMAVTTKGVGNIFLGGAAGAESVRVSKVASQVNAIQASGAVTGVAPSVVARGADTNIDLSLAGKGTGVLQFGTHTVSADAPVTGYITIKDASGVTRKLAVIG